MARSRALVLVVAVTAILASFAPSPANAGTTISYQVRGVSAWGYWDYCAKDACSSIDLVVFEGKTKSQDERFKGTRVCVYISPAGGFRTAESRPPTGETESGCSTARKRTLDVSKDLSTANLAATTVEVEPCSYDPETGDEICHPERRRLIKVVAQWTADGPASQESERYRFDFGDCSETYVARGTFRYGQATATFNGAALGRSGEAELHKGMTKFRSTCEY